MKIATLLFTYNRPKHTAEVLDGLKKNTILPEKLYIFHDGIKATTNRESWEEVETVINCVNWCKCEVITAKKNIGLANSIINGVNYALASFDAVIVLEDDCVPHRLFMDYMNKALLTYEKEREVFSIGASAEPVDVPENGYDAYFVGRIKSCGWGTWKNRWKEFRRDYNLIEEIVKDKELKEWMQVWGQDLEATLHYNMRGIVDSWAVFWALSVIRHKALSLSPYYSLVKNIGFDGTGRHSENKEFDNKLMPDDKEDISLPTEIKVVDNYQNVFADYFRWVSPDIVERYYKDVMLKWYDLIMQGKNLSDWFLANKIKSACVWGLGDVGKRVIHAIKEKVKICAVIESSPSTEEYEGIRVIGYKNLQEHIKNVDCIIVIPGYDIERFRKLITGAFVEALIPVDQLFCPLYIKPDDRHACAKEQIGSQYGGYEIAVDYVPQNAVVLSFGIGEDASFDVEMIKRFDANVYAFDPTPKALDYVSKNMKDIDKFHFYQYGLSDEDKIVKFYLPRNKEWVSGSEYARNELEENYIEVEMKKLSTIVKEIGLHHIDVLKADIEGSEFAVIEALNTSSDVVINQVCLEVHHRFFEDGYTKLEKMHAKLTKLGYRLIYVSDNCEVLTYINEGIL